MTIVIVQPLRYTYCNGNRQSLAPGRGFSCGRYTSSGDRHQQTGMVGWSDPVVWDIAIRRRNCARREHNPWLLPVFPLWDSHLLTRHVLSCQIRQLSDQQRNEPTSDPTARSSRRGWQRLRTAYFSVCLSSYQSAQTRLRTSTKYEYVVLSTADQDGGNLR